MNEPHPPFQRLDYQVSIDRPLLSLPDGKRVAVFLVVNIERCWTISPASRARCSGKGRQIIDWYEKATA